MRHVSLSLFNPISLDDLSEHELFDLVTAAYFLDELETFQKLTRRIVFVYGNALSEAYERYTELLPSNFIRKSNPDLLLLDHPLTILCSISFTAASVC